MVRIREANRAFHRFYAQCFWSSPTNLHIGKKDVAWVAEQLRKHGGKEGWATAAKLCHLMIVSPLSIHAVPKPETKPVYQNSESCKPRIDAN